MERVEMWVETNVPQYKIQWSEIHAQIRKKNSMKFAAPIILSHIKLINWLQKKERPKSVNFNICSYSIADADPGKWNVSPQQRFQRTSFFCKLSIFGASMHCIAMGGGRIPNLIIFLVNSCHVILILLTSKGCLWCCSLFILG